MCQIPVVILHICCMRSVPISCSLRSKGTPHCLQGAAASSAAAAASAASAAATAVTANNVNAAASAAAAATNNAGYALSQMVVIV